MLSKKKLPLPLHCLFDKEIYLVGLIALKICFKIDNYSLYRLYNSIPDTKKQLGSVLKYHFNINI